jgi:hypothetical protein
MPHDELGFGETKYVLARPGHSYVAYGDRVEVGLGLEQLAAGEYQIDWVDCQSGKTVRADRHTVARAGVRTFPKPSGFGPECAAWIRALNPGAAAAPAVVASKRSDQAPPAKNRPAVAKNLSLRAVAGSPAYIQLQVVDEDGPGPYSYTIVQAPTNGTLSGDDNDRTYTAKPGFVGQDRFTWKVNDGADESRAATVEIEVLKAGARKK